MNEGEQKDDLRRRSPGLCNHCGRPVIRPQMRRPGDTPCECRDPELVTWDLVDIDCAALLSMQVMRSF